jgi:membrane fusion protein, multidrug efflux system
MPMLHHFMLRTLAVLATVSLLAGCNGKEDEAKNKKGGMPPVPVQTGVAVKKDMALDLRTIGKIEPIANIAILAQVGGELIGMHFDEGKEVKKGELLFTIQPRLYATRLAEAEANLARDKATATNAQLALTRQQELDRKGAGIKEELDRARAAADAAEAAVKADEALVLIAQTQVGYTTIESPIDGRTGTVRVRPGALIKAADDQAMTTVVQLAPIYVSFSLPEYHLAAIRAAMTSRKLAVSALDPANGRKLGDGELTFVENTVDTSTGTILLKGTFLNTDRALWPGAFVDVVLHLDTERNVIVVPSPAVTLGQKGAQVWVVKAEGMTDLRVVKTGRTIEQETIIVEGIAEGEKVVVNGQSRLLPGAKAIEKTQNPPAAKEAAQASTGGQP